MFSILTIESIQFGSDKMDKYLDKLVNMYADK